MPRVAAIRFAVPKEREALGFYESVGFTVGEPVPTRFGPAARLRRALP